MIRRMASAALAAMAIGCATPRATPAGAPADEVRGPPISEKVKIGNMTYFDLAVCSPAKVEVPTPVNKEILTGLLVSRRPQVMECLVAPANRGSTTETLVTLQLTVTEDGVQRQVNGATLSPQGKACLEQVLAQLPKLAPLTKGATPAVGQLEVRHVAGVSPSVAFGVNQGSDVAGRIRVAAPTFCDCFAPWHSKPPHSVALEVSLKRGAPPEVSHREIDPEATRVATCLQGKVQGLSLAASDAELRLPFTFRLVHSGVAEELPDPANDLKFIQLDGLRGQRNALVAMRVGERINAVNTYDGLVQKYKAKPASVTVKELKDRCAAMLKADEAWVAALEQQLAVDDSTLNLAAALKAQDGKWADAEAAAQKAVAGTHSDLATARKTLDADKAVCPKEKGGGTCCQQCGPKAKPCGDSCIPPGQACTKPSGCACP